MKRLWLLALAMFLASVAVASDGPEWPELSTLSAPTGGGANDAALIVDIQDYDQVADIAGARRNADDWYRWMVKTRKIPLASVGRVSDAGATQKAILQDAPSTACRIRGRTAWLGAAQTPEATSPRAILRC